MRKKQDKEWKYFVTILSFRSLINRGGGEIVSDFEAIYQQYGKIVYSFLLSLSHEETLAEELTQETMFRAIMNIDSFRGDCRISVWLCQIAKNLYFEWAKKSKKLVPLTAKLITLTAAKI